jgi:hypothetical protein
MKKVNEFIFLIFFTASIMLPVSAENIDIGLRMRSDGANVPIAICDKCPSKLKIRKNSTTYSIELVNPGTQFATKWRIRVNGADKAIKKRMKGHFVKAGATGGTWLATLTCKCDAAGSTPVTFNYTVADAYPAIVAAINAKGLSITGASIPESAIRRTMNGVEDTASLKAYCNILGYDSYVSSTCTIDDGRCNYTSPHDNYLDYFVAD